MAVSLAEAEAAYLPTRVQTADYPNLIEGSGEMQTVATGMVLSAAKDKDDPGAAARIARFVDTLFPRFAELQASDRHPKWREVNLTASHSPASAGRRILARAAFGHYRQADRRKRRRCRQGRRATELGHSLDQKEALFKKFIEWQRSSEN